MSDFLIQLCLVAAGIPVFLFFWCRSIRRSDAEFSARQAAKYERVARNSTAFWETR